eukprot:scaffold22996_cov59-Cyclotella_meneghiniana.AAC.7
MAWPMLTGFSFTARCRGKILLSLPTPLAGDANKESSYTYTDRPSRPSVVKLAGLECESGDRRACVALGEERSKTNDDMEGLKAKSFPCGI